ELTDQTSRWRGVAVGTRQAEVREEVPWAEAETLCVPWSLHSPILSPSPLPSPAEIRGGDPAVPVAPVLACPDGWVGYRNVCYYLSRDQGSWEWSQEQCSSRGASLAVLRRDEGLLWVRGGLVGFVGWEQSCVRGLKPAFGYSPCKCISAAPGVQRVPLEGQNKLLISLFTAEKTWFENSLQRNLRQLSRDWDKLLHG
uniref:Uncharacterized protein n=1 Tax=Calidris pygmaea TaxID=425635 RepID=A0A8C3JX48_9CHAR